jgi:copper oxidase (laccase) domain-containing protein
MSFRIEEKLFIKKENLIQFQEFLIKKSVKKIHHPRIIQSLYFDNINLDTFCDQKMFYSYRRSKKTGESDYGRLISVISLKK